MPSIVAAPLGPDTRPFVAASAASICSRSPTPVSLASVFRVNQASSMEKTSPSVRITDVLQLAHVARPVVGRQELERPSFNLLDPLAGQLRVAPHQVLDQQPDVVGPLAKRRHHDGKDVEPIIEVLTDLPLGAAPAKI